MNLLLDTHIFLWLNQQPEKLSANILAHCEDPNNILYLSHVSPWEIQIKSTLGKLALQRPLQVMIDLQQRENGLKLLPINLQHIYALGGLEGFGFPFKLGQFGCRSLSGVEANPAAGFDSAQPTATQSRFK